MFGWVTQFFGFGLGLISSERISWHISVRTLEWQVLVTSCGSTYVLRLFCWLYCLDQHHTSSTSIKAYQRQRDKHTIIDSTSSTPMREFQKSYSKSFGIVSSRSFVSRQFAVFNVAVWVDLGFVLCSSDGSLLRFCCGHASFCCVIWRRDLSFRLPCLYCEAWKVARG